MLNTTNAYRPSTSYRPGEGVAVAGIGRACRIADDRRRLVEQVVDPEAQAAGVAEVPEGGEVEVVLGAEIDPGGPRVLDTADVPPPERGPQWPGGEPGQAQAVPDVGIGRAAAATPVAGAIARRRSGRGLDFSCGGDGEDITDVEAAPVAEVKAVSVPRGRTLALSRWPGCPGATRRDRCPWCRDPSQRSPLRPRLTLAHWDVSPSRH